MRKADKYQWHLKQTEQEISMIAVFKAMLINSVFWKINVLYNIGIFQLYRTSSTFFIKERTKILPLLRTHNLD